MDETRTLERRLDALEHALASGRELSAMRAQATAEALKAIGDEQRSLWSEIEKQQQRSDTLLKEQRDAFGASIEKLRDVQWRLIAGAAALLATQLLSAALRKWGIA